MLQGKEAGTDKVRGNALWQHTLTAGCSPFQLFPYLWPSLAVLLRSDIINIHLSREGNGRRRNWIWSHNAGDAKYPLFTNTVAEDAIKQNNETHPNLLPKQPVPRSFVRSFHPVTGGRMVRLKTTKCTLLLIFNGSVRVDKGAIWNGFAFCWRTGLAWP